MLPPTVLLSAAEGVGTGLPRTVSGCSLGTVQAACNETRQCPGQMSRDLLSGGHKPTPHTTPVSLSQGLSGSRGPELTGSAGSSYPLGPADYWQGQGSARDPRAFLRGGRSLGGFLHGRPASARAAQLCHPQLLGGRHPPPQSPCRSQGCLRFPNQPLALESSRERNPDGDSCGLVIKLFPQEQSGIGAKTLLFFFFFL